jgi:xanthine dehydrogenase accessory factor
VRRTDLLGRAERLRAKRTPFVLATVVRAERPTSAKAGDRALILPDGTIEGFVGGDCAESTVRMASLRILGTGESTLLRITPEPAAEEGAPGVALGTAPGGETAVDGLLTVGNPCLSGGTLEIFLEAVIPPTLVHVFGDAPIARAMAGVGAALGYDVRATTDPEASITPDAGAVVVASHGRDEERVLAAALRAGVRYVGLVASRRRGAAVVAALDAAAEDRERVRTPAGLDIGARTPAEIALSIFAELIAAQPRNAALPTTGAGRWNEGHPAPIRSEQGAPHSRPAEAVDPVCGMTVAVTGSALRLEHGGQDWYFCGTGCRQAFADDPGRYTA